MVEVEEVKELPNYLIQATKTIVHEGRNYRVPATLQVFIDKDNQVRLAREV